jgi:hypothetical protein
MARQKPPLVSVNPLFKLLILINLSLCAICLSVMVVLGLTSKEPTELQRQLYSACETVFKMTAGAFIGLLAGRAAAPDPVQPPSASTPPEKSPSSGTPPATG